MDRHPMTVQGHQFLQAELKRLKTVERPRLSKLIEVAREHGDLSENAEYHAAKEEQGLCEARLRDIEGKLSAAQVIDVSKLSGAKVVFGATVSIQDANTDEKKRFMIVGEDEADAAKGKISYQSPLARALIGKEVDDFISVKLPGGVKEYEVLSVEFIDVAAQP